MKLKDIWVQMRLKNQNKPIRKRVKTLVEAKSAIWHNLKKNGHKATSKGQNDLTKGHDDRIISMEKKSNFTTSSQFKNTF